MLSSDIIKADREFHGRTMQYHILELEKLTISERYPTWYALYVNSVVVYALDVLANRTKNTDSRIIWPEQRGFIKVCFILDNLLMTNESI